MNNVKKVLALGAAAVIAVAVTGCGRAQVDLNNYVVLECEGYDSIGSAQTYIDFDKMVADNPSAFGLSKKSTKSDEAEVASELKYYIDGEINTDEDLSNGDTVTFTWEVDSEGLMEEYPIEPAFSDKQISVSGLEEPKSFDPFEGLKVSFSGNAPMGTAHVSGGSDAVSDIYYTVSKSNGLSNGDKITVNAGLYSEDDFAGYCLKYGYVPQTVEKEYTVEGLAGYALSLNDIPQDALDKMDSAANDKFRAHVADKWNDTETLVDVKLIGNYFIFPKDTSNMLYPYNSLYFIYKVTAKNKDVDNKEFTYYYYSYFDDIMLLADGSCSFDTTGIGVPSGNSFFGSVSGEAFSTGDHFYIGYKELDALFNKQITAKIDRYSYETNIKDE